MLEKLKSYNIFFSIFLIGIIILGIYLRVRYYISNPPFWLDESMFALSFMSDRGIFDMFIELESEQEAPPLFSILTLCIVKLFGLKELVFRFIPFLSGILSLFSFCFLINKSIKNKFAVLVGMFLFAVNIPLVYYSGEFKPYSTDVLVNTLLLISYYYINLSRLTYKQTFLYTLIAMTLILFSFPTMFVIPAIIISKFIEEKKITYRALWIILGVIISCTFMYFIHKYIYSFMVDYWGTQSYGFLSFSLGSFKNMINTFFEFWIQKYEHPTVIFNSIFVFGGLIRIIVLKRKEAVFYSFILLFVIFASLCKIYPCSSRLALYLSPLIILLISSLIDFPNYKDVRKKMISYVMTGIICVSMFSLMHIRYWPIRLNPEVIPIVRRELYDRIDVKNNSTEFLKNYKDGEQALYSYEFYLFFKYYAGMYGINLDMDKKESDKQFFYIEPKFTKREAEQFFEKILKDSGKSNLWITGRNPSEFYFHVCPDEKYIENVLKNKKLKYEKYNNHAIYLFHVYK